MSNPAQTQCKRISKMKLTFQISGMTCEGCANKVKSLIQKNISINEVEVNLSEGIVNIKSEQLITEIDIAQLLNQYPKYKLIEHANKENSKKTNSFTLKTYYPLLLIFLFLISIATWASNFKIPLFMSYFMGSFFLTFSFFKLLDLKGFQMSFSNYDIIAKKIRLYGFIYPFIELFIGWLYLLNFNIIITNTATILFLGIGTIGVVQSVLKKETIKCACLGTVFNLPMSKVTIIENSIMVLMASSVLIGKAI